MPKTLKPNSSQVRIIAGIWRGRKLNFPCVEGLRPTSDRVRETVYNWLMPYIRNAICLDLFAGSGALSFEALSRGAKEVYCLEKNPLIYSGLMENKKIFNADNLHPLCADALTWKLEKNFDIVLLDPPFRKGILPTLLPRIGREIPLAPQAKIYLEAEKELELAPLLANHFRLLKSRTAGQVGYYLLKSI